MHFPDTTPTVQPLEVPNLPNSEVHTLIPNCCWTTNTTTCITHTDTELTTLTGNQNSSTPGAHSKLPLKNNTNNTEYHLHTNSHNTDDNTLNAHSELLNTICSILSCENTNIAPCHWEHNINYTTCTTTELPLVNQHQY